MVVFVHFVFLFLVSLVAKAKAESELYPPIVEVQTFVYNEEEANFTEVETKYFNNNRKNVIAVPGMYLDLTCFASYPIAWRTGGYVAQIPIEILNVNRITHDVSEESSKYFSRIRVATDLNSTGYYNCVGAHNEELEAPLYVFAKNDKHPLINSGQDIIVSGRIIPCRTTNPEILVSLLRPMVEQEDNKYERVTAGYDPKVGFDLGDTYIFGNYLCITPFDKIRVEVVRQLKEPFSVYPNKDSVLLLENDLLNLTCISEGDDIELEYLGNKTDGVRLEATDNSKTFLYRGSAGESGSVSCFSSKVNHTWSFLFIETPRLEFDDRTGAALCYTERTNRNIYSLECSSPAHCFLLKKCLDREDIRGNCESIMYKGATCRPTLEPIQKCARLANTHFSGLIQCVVDSVRVSRSFFTGLNGKRYFDAQNAPQDAIISISSVNRTLTENEPTFFACKANSFLTTQQIKFAFKYSNGSVITVPDDSIQDDPSNSTCAHRGAISRKVYLNLTEEVKEVVCFAPMSNSTEFINASTPVTVKSTMQPLIEGESAATFFLGEAGRNLLCYASGHPAPKLRWVKDGEELSADFTFSDTKDGGLLLHFPEVTEDTTGDYTCLAANDIGKDKLIVNVEVIDRNQTCSSVSFSDGF